MKMEDMSLSGLDNSKLEVSCPLQGSVCPLGCVAPVPNTPLGPQAIAHEIYTELVEDACLGLCFEVHRAVKCGYFFLDDTDPDSMKDFEIVDQPGVDIFGQVYNQWKNKECVCPNCSRSIAASRFAPHLENNAGSSPSTPRRCAPGEAWPCSLWGSPRVPSVPPPPWEGGSPLSAVSVPRSLRCPQHTDEQRRAVRVYLLGPSASLPEAEGSVENDSFEVAESQALMSRLQWDGSSDISPSDSASSKASECSGLGEPWGTPRASTNNSESRKTKKKKPHLGLVSGAPGLGSSKKKKPKPPAPHTPSIYDDIN
ncbi:AT7L3 protein, partial [Copsychus sechellarum]|nr:AT7L3 protein [Copsychus sechellarum]